jgi:hypothetical protein
MANSELLQKINSETSTKISTKVSPSLHPDVLSQHGAVLVDGGTGPGRQATLLPDALCASFMTHLETSTMRASPCSCRSRSGSRAT